MYSYARWENVSSARVFMDYGPEITTETEIFIDDLVDNERSRQAEVSLSLLSPICYRVERACEVLLELDRAATGRFEERSG